MDTQGITSLATLVNYIAKYTSKSEQRSTEMLNFLRTAVQQAREQDTPQNIVQRLLLRMCGERDYSSQEIFYVLMGWNLYRCSRSFVVLKMDDLEWRPINLEGDENGNVVVMKDDQTKYAERSAEYEQCSYKQYHANYYKRGNQTHKQKKEAIIRVFPRLKYVQDDDNEMYFRQASMLEIPWRELGQLNAGQERWEDFFQRMVGRQRQQIEEMDLEDMVAQLENEDEFEEYVEGLDIQDVDRNADWMGVARTGANILPPSPPLGGRAMDEEYAWDQTFSNYEDPNGLKVFLDVQKRMADNEIVNQPNLILQDALPRDAFSEEQKQVIELFEQQISYLHGNRNVNPKKSVIVQGKAGSGKSALIKYMTS